MAQIRRGFFYAGGATSRSPGSRAVFVVGDSHSYYTWDQVVVPGFEIIRYHCGPRLMWTFATRPRAVVRLERLGIIEGDYLVACFGEIDARRWAAIHGIEGLGRRYCDTVAVESRRAGLDPSRVIIMGVVPPQRVPEASRYNGTPEERRTFVQLLNADTALRCATLGFGYLDTYAAYAAQDGFLFAPLAGCRGHVGAPHVLSALLRAAIARTE